MPILPLIADAQLRTLAWLDWAIVIGFVLISLAIGLYFSRRAQGSTEAYFKGGARMGWLLLGTSMVATAFAADTPLALSEWVVTKGLS
jgi:SSS family solute:Na+ symporter